MTKWQTGMDLLNHQSCFAVNFGHNGEIPLEVISLSINMEPRLDYIDFDKYNKCFLVFVGDKYVESMRKVMTIVDYISKQFYGTRPLAVIINGEYDTKTVNSLSKYATHSPMVIILYDFNS